MYWPLFSLHVIVYFEISGNAEWSTVADLSIVNCRLLPCPLPVNQKGQVRTRVPLDDTLPEYGTLIYDNPDSTSVFVDNRILDFHLHVVLRRQMQRKSGKMKASVTRLVAVVGLGLAVSAPVAGASADASKSPQFQTLPPLREQADIVDGWTEKRKALIPGILRKYNVDAWLVRLILRCTIPRQG